MGDSAIDADLVDFKAEPSCAMYVDSHVDPLYLYRGLIAVPQIYLASGMPTIIKIATQQYQQVAPFLYRISM
jgi:hypothetical protein